jgi:hypothetical protein
VSGTPPAEQLVLKVTLETEDLAWIQHLEPLWHINIISIEQIYANLHPDGQRPDKGRIADAYLRWLIENYNTLPEIIVFLPPADSRQKDPLDALDTLSRLHTPFIQASGFANLKCPTQISGTTCNGKSLITATPSYEIRTMEANITTVWQAWFGDEIAAPEVFATVLGAEFAVSKSQVRKRSGEDYVKYWTWLNNMIMDDDSAGLVFEFLWHVVFSKDAVFCPERARCECDLYGKCDGS